MKRRLIQFLKTDLVKTPPLPVHRDKNDRHISLMCNALRSAVKARLLVQKSSPIHVIHFKKTLISHHRYDPDQWLAPDDFPEGHLLFYQVGTKAAAYLLHELIKECIV